MSVWSIATIQIVIQIGLPMVKLSDIPEPRIRFPPILILHRMTLPYFETNVAKNIAFDVTPCSFSIA